MIFRDINIINTCYVLHPEKSIPPDLCPADEIAAPCKLMKVLGAPLRAWRLHTYNNHEFYYLRVKWHRYFHRGVYSEYFYVLCDDPGIFGRFARGEQTREDYRGVFTVTCPIFSYLKGFRAYNYSVSNSFTSTVDIVYPHDNHIDFLLNNAAYTICNGLIIELAKMRAGAANQVGYNAILRDYDIYGHIPEHYMNLYITHQYPQITDHPYLYYYVVDCPVTDFLNETYNPHDLHTNQYTDAMNRICYRTSQRIIRFSVAPRFNENDIVDRPADKHMIDFVGLIRGISERRAVYRWYLRNRVEIFARYLEFHRRTTITQFLLKRVFTIYHERPCRRLFQVFKDILAFMDPKPFWIHRSIILGLIKTGDEWQPSVPIGFIKHCAGIVFTQVTFRIFTIDDHVKSRIEEIFDDYIVPVSDYIGDTVPIKIRIRLWDILDLAPGNSNAGRSRLYYERRVLSRIGALSALCSHNAAIMEPMRSWFEKNRDALIS